MTKNIFILCLSLFSLTYCGTDQAATQQAEQQKLWDEVMAIHDEVMPKIGNINKAVKEFKDVRENNSEGFEKYRERILMQLQKLERAEEGMFSWMNQLKQLPELREKMEHEAIVTHLTKEKEAIIKVRDDMLGSLESSLALISTIKDDTAQ